MGALRFSSLRRYGVLLALGGLGVLAPRLAIAQSAADRETARLLMDRGDERARKGDFASALTLYRGADEIMHVPTTGIEVARTYASLNKLVEARDAALAVLRLPVASDEPGPFREARVAADQLERELFGQIPQLEIEVAPREAAARATLRLDGAEVPRATLQLPHSLNPEAHRIELVAVGYRPVDVRVTLTGGERKLLRLALEPLPPTQLQVRMPAQSATSQATLITSHAPVAQRPLPWPAWVGAGLGGAGLVLGSVAGVIALDRVRAARKHCNGNVCSPEAQPDRDAALSAARLSNAGWALCGVGAAIGLTSLWLWSGGPSRRASLRLNVGFGTASLRISGDVW